ncbi:hypothetical protein THOM_1281 [Trachipleistophora hominis]|uniref:Uncharacterized protein n=1 Tax=Trachipleistophora hominis TaxID=72359 RepID=L7JWB2_TRAHO|nr:hypothetical protein THOM_1281 [Trachipleistophora hominis]
MLLLKRSLRPLNIILLAKLKKLPSMPIIIVCGDDEYVKQFCDDYTNICSDKNVVVHNTAFSEAISDVIEDDPSFFHIITRSYSKSERYISYCHAKRFKTGYIVVFLRGACINVDLEVPLESNRYDNPLITVNDYKNDIFDNINNVLCNTKMKKFKIKRKNHNKRKLHKRSKEDN